MAKIYAVPEEIEAPKLSFSAIGEYKKECEEFLAKLKEILQKRKPGIEEVGEVIRFPVADGYAEYMVAGIKPVELVHLPLYDAWQFQYAGRLTATDVRQEIKKQHALKKMFSKPQEDGHSDNRA